MTERVLNGGMAAAELLSVLPSNRLVGRRNHAGLPFG
jgi:hypothetical protein